MKLEGGFYKVKERRQTENGFSAVLELVCGHAVYRGHFPGKPVVPGVCTLTMVREQICAFLGRPVHFRRMKECKFISALVPEEGLCIQLEVQFKDAQTLSCTVGRGDTGILKLKAEL